MHKKLLTLVTLAAIITNTHTASNWDWRSSEKTFSNDTQNLAKNQLDDIDAHHIPWYQFPDVGPLLTAATRAIEHDDLKTLRNVVSQAFELNLPYNVFDRFISRLQSVNSFGNSGLHYKAIDNLLSDVLQAAYAREQVKPQVDL